MAASTKTIGTHDGSFHCDEVLACSMLKLLPQWKDAEIVRSRDPATLDACDIVVDVGAVFDPSRHRYDHHQRGFEEVLGGKFNAIKLSSAGLVYKYFGRDILKTLVPMGEAELGQVYDKVYENFIESVDAIDNGISQYPADVPKKYRITSDLGSRIGRLNPAWNEPDQDTNAAFMRAMEVAQAEFIDQVNSVGRVWLPARSIVQQSLEGRFQVHPSGRIVKLLQQCPWKEHLFQLEQELGVEELVLYVLFQDDKGHWRIQCVPNSPTGFENRKSLPEPWRGLRDDALSSAAEIDGCIFVHASGFIGGVKTYEGALRMAELALQF